MQTRIVSNWWFYCSTERIIKKQKKKKHRNSWRISGMFSLVWWASTSDNGRLACWCLTRISRLFTYTRFHQTDTIFVIRTERTSPTRSGVPSMRQRRCREIGRSIYWLASGERLFVYQKHLKSADKWWLCDGHPINKRIQIACSGEWCTATKNPIGVQNMPLIFFLFVWCCR